MRWTMEVDKPVDCEQLAAEIKAACGCDQPPGVGARAPGQPDGRGGVRPGVVTVDMDDPDPAVLSQVVEAHQAPAPDPDPFDTLQQRVADLEAEVESLRADVDESRGRLVTIETRLGIIL